MESYRDELGRFAKGITPWNKGKTGVYSEEVLKRMSRTKKGKRINPKGEFKKGHTPWNKNKKGLHLYPETEFKIGHKWAKKINKKRLKNLRKKVMLKPNLKMTKNLAYLVGLLKGDGCVTHNGASFRICFDNTNQTLANNCLNSLKEIGLHPFVYDIIPYNGIGKKKIYKVVANSKKFYEWYKKLTLQDLKKSLNTKEKTIGFLKGFYEAEGSISTSRNTVTISISNTDLKLLKVVKILLEQLDLYFRLNGPYKNNGLGGYKAKLIYRVLTSSRENVFSFINLVKPSAKTINPIQT